MEPTNLKINTVFYLCITFILASSIIKQVASQDARAVFPFDVVRFSCDQPALPRDQSGKAPMCKWKFHVQKDGVLTVDDSVTRPCAKVKGKNLKDFLDDGLNERYESYVEVPRGATNILCEGTDRDKNTEHPIDIQNVEAANPLIGSNNSNPTIILQRFTNDYGARLGSHVVTDKQIKINGAEVDSLKLFCIHDAHVTWQNFRESRQRVLKELAERDSKWLSSKSGKLEQKWKAYTRLLLEGGERSSEDFETRISPDKVIYTAPLTIRNVTNATSRTYECVDITNHQSVFVYLTVENPKAVGPDDLQLIEQIIGILDSQGNRQGNEPWAALGSVLSIFLVISLYYLKRSIDQRQNNNDSPKPKSPAAAAEEIEMRTSLQQSSQQEQPAPEHQTSNQNHHETPVSVTVEK